VTTEQERLQELKWSRFYNTWTRPAQLNKVREYLAYLREWRDPLGNPLRETEVRTLRILLPGGTDQPFSEEDSFTGLHISFTLKEDTKPPGPQLAGWARAMNKGKLRVFVAELSVLALGPCCFFPGRSRKTSTCRIDFTQRGVLSHGAPKERNMRIEAAFRQPADQDLTLALLLFFHDEWGPHKTLLRVPNTLGELDYAVLMPRFLGVSIVREGSFHGLRQAGMFVPRPADPIGSFWRRALTVCVNDQDRAASVRWRLALLVRDLIKRAKKAAVKIIKKAAASLFLVFKGCLSCLCSLCHFGIVLCSLVVAMPFGGCMICCILHIVISVIALCFFSAGFAFFCRPFLVVTNLT
jgi:hypothetical protein